MLRMLQIIGSRFSHHSGLLRQRELGILSNFVTVRPPPLPIYCCLRFFLPDLCNTRAAGVWLGKPKLTAYQREKGVVCLLQA